MEKRLFAFSVCICLVLLNGCMSREEAAKHVTITLIQSPEASLAEWHPVEIKTAETQRFESPLGSVEITRTPTKLTSTSQSSLNNNFEAFKQQVEKQIFAAQSSLIHPADDDLLQLAETDFLHTTYHTRDQNNQRQRIELYLAPINQQLITITVRIGDDVDMQSYNELQTFLTQQITQINKMVKPT